MNKLARKIGYCLGTVAKMVMCSIKRAWRGIKCNLDTIGVLIIIVSPASQLFCVSTRDSIITNMMIIWVGLVLLALDRGIHNKQHGIPVMRKHFVHYNKSNDSVYVKEDDWNEVVNYLADLQEYFEGGGML